VVEVLLGFGANLGDPVATIGRAIEKLDTSGVRLSRRSHFYRTRPWGLTAQPDFVNLCAAAETTLEPEELLGLICRIENGLGRERRERWGPRRIDIDILTYGDQVRNGPDLQIPHPRLTERAFVLVPLSEIAPDKPIAGRTVKAWAEIVGDDGVERIA
jgi:2-amino-4-hydroxy-6-hydroxymethyldihydropteridine diphosphokinase